MLMPTAVKVFLLLLLLLLMKMVLDVNMLIAGCHGRNAQHDDSDGSSDN